MYQDELWRRVLPASPQVGEFFAQNFRHRREEIGLSQAAVVKQMRQRGWEQFNPMALHRTEKGIRRVGVDEALALAEIVETDLRWLMATPETVEYAHEIFAAKQWYEEAQRKLYESFKDVMVAQEKCANLMSGFASEAELTIAGRTVPPSLVRGLKEALEAVVSYADITPESAADRLAPAYRDEQDRLDGDMSNDSEDEEAPGRESQ